MIAPRDAAPATPPESLRALLAPGRWGPLVVPFALLATALGGFLLGSGRAPLWAATLIAVAVAAIPWTLKWRDDLRRVGAAATALAILLALQGFHTVEHTVQLLQVYLLDRPAARALGLVTAANAEWIHLAWNAAVLLGVGWLTARGMRSRWAWLLLAWAGLHTAEHGYLFVRYLQVAAEANALGVGGQGVLQGLPGVLGRDGWLALQSWCGRIPGLTTAPRVVVHFAWNAGEIVLLVLAARAGLPGLLRSRPPRSPRFRPFHPAAGGTPD